MMEYDLTLFEKGLEQLSVELSQEQKNQFLSYYELLVNKNKVMNLTAITEYEEVVVKHFLDSLAVVKTPFFAKDDLKKKKLLDMGTGAGFPGIPLKIAFPDLQVVLLDSLKKRVVFLEEVIDQLGLQGITAVHGRAEDFARRVEYREAFDYVVSRAVANLSTLSEYCIPYVKVGGFFLSYKSAKLEEELPQAKKAIFLLGGELEETVRFSLLDLDMERAFAIVRKSRVTPKKYPRKAGLPGKEPLA